MSADVRICLVSTAGVRHADVEAIRELLRGAAPYSRIRVHELSSQRDLSDEVAHREATVAAALQSDVVLYIDERSQRAAASLIALRERAGFTVRFSEPEFARAWLSVNRRRSLYVVGDCRVRRQRWHSR